MDQGLVTEVINLTERFGEEASKILKAGARYENVSPEAMATMTSTMLLAYLFMRKGLHHSAQEETNT